MTKAIKLAECTRCGAKYRRAGSTQEFWCPDCRAENMKERVKLRCVQPGCYWASFWRTLGFWLTVAEPGWHFRDTEYRLFVWDGERMQRATEASKAPGAVQAGERWRGPAMKIHAQKVG